MIPSSVAGVKQAAEETPTEHVARAAQGFPTVEASLHWHTIGSRLSSPWLDSLSSALGTKNPLATEIDPATDEVWLLDNIAYQPDAGSQAWAAEFVAAYFVRHSGKDLSRWVAAIANTIGLGANDHVARATIERRLRPFAATIRPARFVNIVLEGNQTTKLGPGARNAISSQVVSLGSGHHPDGRVLEVDTVPAEVAPLGQAFTRFTPPEGWVVVSDIDDSIKITMTPSPLGVLRSTFVSDPSPIEGMPELYARIDRRLYPAWFYLSASPYNLYMFLRPFLHTYYPPGTLILRDASWEDPGGFLKSLTQGTAAYKESRINKIHDWLPGRRVLCVGDSTQSDPEAYGAMYRKYGPGWVQRIFIRRVADINETMTVKNSPARFMAAFRHVPTEVWTVFDDPTELYAAVDALVR